MNINQAITTTTGMGYPWLLIFKEKHRDRHYLITCPTDIKWACYEVVQDCIEYITREPEPQKPEGLKTADEIQELPAYLQPVAKTELRIHLGRVENWRENEALCDLADKVRAGNSMAAVRLVIETRRDEYWGYECEKLLRPRVNLVGSANMTLLTRTMSCVRIWIRVSLGTGRGSGTTGNRLTLTAVASNFLNPFW